MMRQNPNKPSLLFLVSFFVWSSYTIIGPISAGDMAVVTCPKAGLVKVIDLNSRTILDEIPVNSYPFDLVLASNGEHAYVTGLFSSDVSVVNLRSKQVDKVIPVGFAPTGLALTPDGAYLWVCNAVAGAPDMENIVIIDTSTRRIVQQLKTRLISPFKICFTLDGSLAIVTHPIANFLFSSSYVTIIDAKNYQELETISVGVLPTSIVMHPSGQYAYVANTFSSSISVLQIEPGSVKVIDNFSFKKFGSYPTHMAISPDLKRLQVVLTGLNLIAVLDISKPDSIHSLFENLGVDDLPIGITYCSDGKHSLVTNTASNTISIINNCEPPFVERIVGVDSAGPLAIAVNKRVVTKLVTYLPDEAMPIDFGLLQPDSTVHLNVKIADDLTSATDAYLEIAIFDLDMIKEMLLYLNDEFIRLPVQLIGNGHRRIARFPIDLQLLTTGDNKIHIKDNRNLEDHFRVDSLKILVAFTVSNPGHKEYPVTFQNTLSQPAAKTGLFNNFPNPFNPTTEIRFDLAEECHTTLSIVNVAGQTVRTLVDKKLVAGSHLLTWDGMDDYGKRVASGVYLYILTAGGRVLTNRMLFLK